MNKTFLFLSIVFLTGCSTVSVTNYIAANHPVEKKFLADYDKTLAAVNKVLIRDGWQIEGAAEPTVFERSSETKPGTKSVVVFTKVRKSAWILFSTYTHLNVFIYSQNDETQVEIRYASVSAWPFKQFHRYRNDGLTDRLMRYLESELAVETSNNGS